jgi:hypothetical protein
MAERMCSLESRSFNHLFVGFTEDARNVLDSAESITGSRTQRTHKSIVAALEPHGHPWTFPQVSRSCFPQSGGLRRPQVRREGKQMTKFCVIFTHLYLSQMVTRIHRANLISVTGAHRRDGSIRIVWLHTFISVHGGTRETETTESGFWRLQARSTTAHQ